MDQLWAPWRLSYVTQPKPPTEQEPCFICRGLAQDDDRNNLIVLRNPCTVVILNRYPYNNGHLLIAPHQHRGNIEDLTGEEMLECNQTLQQVVRLLKELIKPDGFNIGLNLGRAAGAGLPGHVHWHVVPRWSGDTNFMPVFSDTRVIVQSLDSMFELLHGRLQEKAT